MVIWHLYSMVHFSALFFLLVLLSFNAQAFHIGKELPSLVIDNKGIITLEEESFGYQPWKSQELAPKRWLIQHISPLPVISELNVRVPKYLNTIDTPKGQCRTVTIINTDEAIWGTKHIIHSKLKKSLKLNPQCHIIVDAKGTAQKQWQLKKKSYSIAVIDEQQRVLFAHDGEISDEQFTKVLTLLGVPEESASPSR